MGKWGNGEMGKWENGEMGKWENGEKYFVLKTIKLPNYQTTTLLYFHCRTAALSNCHTIFLFGFS
jgi:hypothetical protein